MRRLASMLLHGPIAPIALLTCPSAAPGAHGCVPWQMYTAPGGLRPASTGVDVPAPAEGLQAGEGSEHGAEDDGLSLHLEEGAFDAVEASCQEIHDLALALVTHYKRMGATARMTDHKLVRKQYRNAWDAKRGETLANEWVDKICLHLTQEVFDRLMQSGSMIRHQRVEARQARFQAHKVLPAYRARATVLPVMYQHAPYLLEQLRSDIQPYLVDQAKARRDLLSLNYLRKLTALPTAHQERLISHLTLLAEKTPVTDYRKSTQISMVDSPEETAGGTPSAEELRRQYKVREMDRQEANQE